MASMLTDLRFGARLLLRSPGFTLVAVTSLAIGIGANAAIFGAINGLLLKPLPVAAPDRLVAIFTSDFSGPRYGGSSYLDAVDFARGTPALAGLAVADINRLSLTASAQPERVFAEHVSPNYFDVLGLASVAGRLPSGALTDSPTCERRPHPSLLAARFDGDPGVVGRTIRLGREGRHDRRGRATGYAGLTRGLDLDLFVVEAVTGPAPPDAGPRPRRDRRAVRRHPEQAQPQLTAVAPALREAYPQE